MLPTPYQHYIALSKYARFRDDLGRRETWAETVQRYIDFMKNQTGLDDPKLFAELYDAILNLEVMPSMRAMMTAGPALERDNVAGFNCSYLPINHLRSFDELMYILMCGTGVGFSVERQYVKKLPEVSDEFHDTDTTIHVADSKIGWAKAFRELLSLLYSGQVPKWDVSKVRGAGARLNTFGGRASGPQPLVELFQFAVTTIRGASGRQLTSLECHDLCCKVAEVIVVGGVRRSALISLSNLSDDRMRHAKNGQFPKHRYLSNNSAVYDNNTEFETFFAEMQALYQSRAGERGIFSRSASQKQASVNGRRDPDYDFGTNPCSEIILRPNQFCNLSEVVVRDTDDAADLKRKVELATILGTFQATLTNFRYLRKCGSDTTAEEALLGVSMTGIMDNCYTNGEYGTETLRTLLKSLRGVAVQTNAKMAKRLGINPSTAITCVKPSGTVSQLVDSASGIHARHSEFYIRRVRGDIKDPLTQLMLDQKIPCEASSSNPNDLVFSFPMKAPARAVVREDVSAQRALDLWETYQDNWCEHKPSCTISYNDDEFFGICQWLWERLDKVSGLSFFPRDDAIYEQPPYEAITQDHYHLLIDQIPSDIDWDQLSNYEVTDQTTSTQTLACSGPEGVCEL